jgi:hypothetical protein
MLLTVGLVPTTLLLVVANSLPAFALPVVEPIFLGRMWVLTGFMHAVEMADEIRAASPLRSWASQKPLKVSSIIFQSVVDDDSNSSYKL